MRTATSATSVCGVDLPDGAILIVNMGAANHDATRWADADSFDINRQSTAHVAFASGPHMCLGMHLARMETKVAINQILDRLPNLRLDPDAEPPYITGMTFRAPPRLDVVFDTT
jgi:cytochrome P450